MIEAHTARMTNPRVWAIRVLDVVRDGRDVSRGAIDLALQITGDLPTKNESQIHEHEANH